MFDCDFFQDERLVCHKSQQEASDIHMTSSITHGLKGGCLSIFVESSRYVCLPSVCPELEEHQLGDDICPDCWPLVGLIGMES